MEKNLPNETDDLTLLSRVRKFLKEREEKIVELNKTKEELEEAKSVLEIKVATRTRELKELAESLEEKVKGRTKQLEERVDELEAFHLVTVGRETKMIELKEKIKELEKKLEEKS